MILGDIGDMAKTYPNSPKADPTKPYVIVARHSVSTPDAAGGVSWSCNAPIALGR
jgi:hypothetical protein